MSQTCPQCGAPAASHDTRDPQRQDTTMAGAQLGSMIGAVGGRTGMAVGSIAGAVLGGMLGSAPWRARSVSTGFCPACGYAFGSSMG